MNYEFYVTSDRQEAGALAVLMAENHIPCVLDARHMVRDTPTPFYVLLTDYEHYKDAVNVREAYHRRIA